MTLRHATPFALVATMMLARAAVCAAEPAVCNDRLVVAVHGLRNDHGAVHCVLYDNADHFPEGRQHRIAVVDGHPANGSALCTFENVPHDRQLAVAIHHDENNDHVFQRGFLGLPLEGYGFSNDARPVMSAPSFEACRFSVASGNARVNITARY